MLRATLVHMKRVAAMRERGREREGDREGERQREREAERQQGEEGEKREEEGGLWLSYQSGWCPCPPTALPEAASPWGSVP